MRLSPVPKENDKSVFNIRGLKLQWHIQKNVNWRQKFHKGKAKASTCIVVFVRLFNLVDKSDTDLAEKVHEERSVEVFAHLVENKPGEAGFVWRRKKVCKNAQFSPVAKFCGLDKDLDRLNLSWLLEVLVKSHREQVVSQPCRSAKEDEAFNPLRSLRHHYICHRRINLHWMARYRRRTRPMRRRRRNHHQRTKNTWYGRQSSNMLLSVTPDLVVDNVEAKYADCIYIFLTAWPTPPPVVARSCQGINIFLKLLIYNLLTFW